MDIQQQKRLSELLRGLRGEESIRSYCSSRPIHWSAWRSWESLDSCPNVQSLQAIADLLGWSFDQMLAYLRTGDPNQSPFDDEQIVNYLRSLPLDRRATLVGKVLAQ